MQDMAKERQAFFRRLDRGGTQAPGVKAGRALDDRPVQESMPGEASPLGERAA